MKRRSRSAKDEASSPSSRELDTRYSRRAIFAFVGAGILAMTIIVAVGVPITGSIAEREALRHAKDDVLIYANEASSLIPQTPISGTVDPELDKLIRSRVLSDQIVRIKIYDATRTIVYSDNRTIVGTRSTFDQEQRRALALGGVSAEFLDLTRPEYRDDLIYGRLLDVIVGIRTPDHRPMLFEAYVRFDTVSQDGNRIMRELAPPVLGGFLALLMVQVPLAIALNRRLIRTEADRRQLLQRAIESSDRERLRIAADLHDTVVQGLAGTSFSLAGLANDAEAEGRDATAARLRQEASDLRQWVRELRTMIINVAPPRLQDAGIEAALQDVISAFDQSGVEVQLHISDGEFRSIAVEALVFRAAQEALRNAFEHAEATMVSVEIDISPSSVRTVVSDDGKGFTPDDRQFQSSEGHIGLSLLKDLVEQVGGTFSVSSARNMGTTVTVEVPNR